MSRGRRVVVVGGGLAGITAALDCAAAGAEVALVEVRRRLGGAVYSFEREGLQIDNGQHVFMRCCRSYRALLARLGSDGRVSVQRRLNVPVLKPGARASGLSRGALPAPLQMATAVARYHHLSALERVRAARVALALMRLDPLDDELDRHTFAAWLGRHGQGSGAIGALWDVIVRPTVNLPASEASLAAAAFVLRAALLSDADAGDIGFHAAPLSEIVDRPARLALERAGVDVKLGWRAQELRPASGGYELAGGAGGFSAEAVIVALPPTRAAALLAPLLPGLTGRVARLGSSPIVNLHIVFDRQVCELAFAAGVGTPVQYVFDRTRAGGVAPGAQYLAVSLSAAEREMAMSVDALRELYLPALAELLPRVREAKVEHFVVTREHAATFRAAPGAAALRPGPRTAHAGLALAGSWTDTGWPATLESATMSGHAAAGVALTELELAPARAVPASFAGDGARAAAHMGAR